MDLNQIKELMGYLEASKLSKLTFKKGDLEISLEKESHHPVMVSRPSPVEPVVDSAFHSESGKKNLFELRKRAGNAFLPSVELIDAREKVDNELDIWPLTPKSVL